MGNAHFFTKIRFSIKKSSSSVSPIRTSLSHSQRPFQCPFAAIVTLICKVIVHVKGTLVEWGWWRSHSTLADAQQRRNSHWKYQQTGADIYRQCTEVQFGSFQWRNGVEKLSMRFSPCSAAKFPFTVHQTLLWINPFSHRSMP